MRRSHATIDQIRKLDCTAFVDELVEEGPRAVREWFESRCDDPCDGPPPSDYNGWSSVAKKLSCALHSALKRSERDEALEFADVACRIYEQILPQMTVEVDAMGFGGIGVNFTEVEGIAIRIEILNHFGPQPGSHVASLDGVENIVVRSVDTHCRVNLVDAVNFSDVMRRSCIENHLRILQNLDRRHLTPLLRKCLENYREPGLRLRT